MRRHIDSIGRFRWPVRRRRCPMLYGTVGPSVLLLHVRLQFYWPSLMRWYFVIAACASCIPLHHELQMLLASIMDINKIVNDESVESSFSDRCQDEQTPGTPTTAHGLPPFTAINHHLPTLSSDSIKFPAADYRSPPSAWLSGSPNEVIERPIQMLSPNLESLRENLFKTQLAQLPLPPDSVSSKRIPPPASCSTDWSLPAAALHKSSSLPMSIPWSQVRSGTGQRQPPLHGQGPFPNPHAWLGAEYSASQFSDTALPYNQSSTLPSGISGRGDVSASDVRNRGYLVNHADCGLPVQSDSSSLQTSSLRTIPSALSPKGSATRKKRQRFDPLSRLKVKSVRHMGSCITCRMYKESVLTHTLPRLTLSSSH